MWFLIDVVINNVKNIFVAWFTAGCGSENAKSWLHNFWKTRFFIRSWNDEEFWTRKYCKITRSLHWRRTNFHCHGVYAIRYGKLISNFLPSFESFFIYDMFALFYRLLKFRISFCLVFSVRSKLLNCLSIFFYLFFICRALYYITDGRTRRKCI